MRRADRLAAGGTLRHLVHPDQLPAAALAMAQARRAQPATALGCVRARLLGVPVANGAAAAGAPREAQRAGRVPVVGADALVGRAVLEPARRAEAHVLVTRRLTVHAALGDTVVGAEVLGAHR